MLFSVQASCATSSGPFIARISNRCSHDAHTLSTWRAPDNYRPGSTTIRPSSHLFQDVTSHCLPWVRPGPSVGQKVPRSSSPGAFDTPIPVLPKYNVLVDGIPWPLRQLRPGKVSESLTRASIIEATAIDTLKRRVSILLTYPWKTKADIRCPRTPSLQSLV